MPKNLIGIQLYGDLEALPHKLREAADALWLAESEYPQHGGDRPGLTIAAWCLWNRDRSLLRRLHILKGLGVTALVVLPWLAATGLPVGCQSDARAQ